MEQHLKEIKQAYKRVAKDGANNSSLIVYSGGMYNGYNCRRHKISQPNCNCFGRFEFLESEGCLYLGDTDLNQPKLLDTLINRLNIVIDRISTIQIPHHGAYKNFNPNIMMLNANWQDFFCFIWEHKFLWSPFRESSIDNNSTKQPVCYNGKSRQRLYSNY